jgi:Protein of unknown function (DUF3300)
MQMVSGIQTQTGKTLGMVFSLLAFVTAAVAQAPPPPAYPPQELDRLVQRIALYPDPLLSQILAAATFSDEIPQPLNGPTSITTSPATLSQEPSPMTISLGIRAYRRSCRFLPCST